MPGRPRSFWIPLVAAVERGADLYETAAHYGVNPSTLAWWRTMIRREERAALPTLLPVVVRPPPPAEAPSAADHIELLVAGATVRVPVGVDVQYIAALVRALERAC
jgi:transposase-like protein